MRLPEKPAAAGIPSVVPMGGFLENRQRLGVFPTLAFWHRRDVWRIARWFVAPVVSVTVALGTLLHVVVPRVWVPVTALLLGVLPPLATMGMLERYIRKRRPQAPGS